MRRFKLIPSRLILFRCLTILLLLAVTIGLILYVGSAAKAKKRGVSAASYVTAQVESVISDNTSPDPQSGGRRIGEQQLSIKILQGPHKGEHMQVANYLSALNNVYTKKGTRIVVQVNTQQNGSYSASVYNYDRSGTLLGCAVVFLLLLCLVGGRKGFQSMLGIVYTVICVVFVLLPMVYQGADAILSALLIVALTTVMGFALLDGINAKTISASVATIAGALFSCAAAGIAGAVANLSGFNMQEAETLLLQSDNGARIAINGLLVAGILIAAHGAVMDVAISIASSMDELIKVNPGMKRMELFRSGIHIGRDAMGTMVNTLILAFVGSALNLLLIIYAYGIPIGQLINTDLVGIQIIQGIAGSIGIILTAPLTAVLSAFLSARRKAAEQPVSKIKARKNRFLNGVKS